VVCVSVSFGRGDRVLDGAKQGKFTYELLVFFGGLFIVGDVGLCTQLKAARGLSPPPPRFGA